MLEQIGSIYRDSWRAAWLFPVLFLIPALVEFAQHVVEMKAGMYDSLAGAKAVIDHQMQIALTFAVSLASALPGYWFVRFLAFRDAARATKIEQPAFALWLVVMIIVTTLQATRLFAPSLGTVLGLTGNSDLAARFLAALFWLLLTIYMTAWTVAWPLGNRAIGPVQSLKMMIGSFWRTIGYMLGSTLPLVALQIGLSTIATTFTSGLLDGFVLGLESVIAGLLACCAAGGAFLAARHAADRKGLSLTGEALKTPF